MGKDESTFKKKKTKLGQQKKSVTQTDLKFRTRGLALKLLRVLCKILALASLTSAPVCAAIFMPEQSVQQEHGEFVTHRNMSLVDLLPQVKHHNDNVRRDALLQIKDLITKFPHLLDFNMADICERIVECVVDLQRNVRQALQSLLHTMLPAVTEEFMAPFFPLFIVYMTSALTHLKQSIRVDALSFINIWVKYFPRLVAAEHSKFLRHYVTVLSHKEPTAISSIRVNSSNTASLEITGEKTRRLVKEDKYAQRVERFLQKKAAGPTHEQVRTQVMDSLCSLLKCTFEWIDSKNVTTAAQIEEDHETAEGDTVVVKKSTQGRSLLWRDNARNEIDLSDSFSFSCAPITLSSIFEGEAKRSIMTRASSGTGPAYSSSEIDFRLDVDPRTQGGLIDFVTTLFPMLLNIWVETEPAVLTSSTQVHSLQSVCDTLHFIVSRLCTSISSTMTDIGTFNIALETFMKEIVRHVAPHFPAASPAGWTEAERVDVIKLNVSLIKIFSSFIVYAGHAGAKNVRELLERALDHLPALFHIKGPNDMDVSEATGFNKAELSLLVSLFPTLQAIITNNTCVTQEQRVGAIAAFDKVFSECGPKSAAKRACVYFVRDLLLSTQSKLSLLPQETVNFWLESLPKILWQLQDSNHGASLAILKLLKFYSQRSYVTKSTDLSVMSDIQQAFIPFFFTEIMTEKRGQTIKKELYGPFINLPEEVQRAAVELVFYFNKLTPNMLSGVIRCLTHTRPVPSDDAMDVDSASDLPKSIFSCSIGIFKYFLESLQHDKHFSSVQEFIGFQVSLLLASCKTPAGGQQSDNKAQQQRIRKVASAVAFRLSSLGMGSETVESVSKVLVPILKKPSTVNIHGGALLLLGQLFKFSSPKVHVLPRVLDPEFLAQSMLDYLHSHFHSTGTTVDLNSCKHIVLIYPTQTLGFILEKLLPSKKDNTIFEKTLLEELLVTHQDAYLSILPALKAPVEAAVQRLVATGPSASIDRLQSELDILYR